MQRVDGKPAAKPGIELSSQRQPRFGALLGGARRPRFDFLDGATQTRHTLGPAAQRHSVSTPDFVRGLF